jgi:16S rRNA (guanine527-N7)-methyltransferase
MDENQITLRAQLQAIGIAATEEEVTRLQAFLDELCRWNKRFGFIKADAEELISLHLLDALAGLALLKANVASGTILDFGSGAGFPGLPLAFFMPEHQFVLCERKAKENAFLKNAAALLKLENVIVIDDLALMQKGSLAAVIFRAVTSLKEILSVVKPYLAPQGILFAYKGKRKKIDEEVAELSGLDLEVNVHKLDLPETGRERHIVVVKNAGAA